VATVRALRVVKLPTSTEWVLHCATTLAQLDAGASASTAQLAEYYDLPPAYLAKQLKALVRAGLLIATTGPRGGFRLARPASEITLLQIVEAVDGCSAMIRCCRPRPWPDGRAVKYPSASPRWCRPGESAARPFIVRARPGDSAW
jgi:Rrf2 family protein